MFTTRRFFLQVSSSNLLQQQLTRTISSSKKLYQQHHEDDYKDLTKQDRVIENPKKLRQLQKVCFSPKIYIFIFKKFRIFKQNTEKVFVFLQT